MTYHRSKRIIELFSNAPKKVICKMCEAKFPNPILNGSSVVVKVCEDCRYSFYTSKTKRKKERIVQAEIKENMKTPNSIRGWLRWAKA
tara:strand:+ start:73 stop:336 length:264 start_codon:yes stop_codon:yes gene_type:complete